MDEPPDSSGGQPSDTHQTKFTLADVLAVFERRSDQAKPLTANDVMDAVDCSRRTAHNKLGELVETGALETRKVGARSRVWWIPISSATDNAATAASTQRDPAVDAQIADAELPGSGKDLRERRQALRAAYDYISDNPEATRTEVLTTVFPDNAVGCKTADEWWAMIEPAIADLPNIDVKLQREHVWHHVKG
jgi:hypothetical protein